MKKPIITFTAFLFIIAGIMYGQEKTAALDNAKQVINKENALFIGNKEQSQEKLKYLALENAGAMDFAPCIIANYVFRSMSNAYLR